MWGALDALTPAGGLEGLCLTSLGSAHVGAVRRRTRGVPRLRQLKLGVGVHVSQRDLIALAESPLYAQLERLELHLTLMAEGEAAPLAGPARRAARREGWLRAMIDGTARASSSRPSTWAARSTRRTPTHETRRSARPTTIAWAMRSRVARWESVE